VAGEDSGLEVDALGGRPGVRSARFAGEHAPDAENVAKLLRELEGVPSASRTARYVCELVCLGPGGEELRGSGTLEGAIAEAPHGEGGFGYDPVFVPADRGDGRTMAELTDAEKDAISHRGRAVRLLRAWLDG
jgi:XTP/dITP diphosphohydrolase